jgi:hypothetical protein
MADRPLHIAAQISSGDLPAAQIAPAPVTTTLVSSAITDPLVPFPFPSPFREGPHLEGLRVPGHAAPPIEAP